MYSMYVGEGEALLRNTFQRARLAAPSIIFFDEADVVAAKRLVCYIYSIRFCVCARALIFFIGTVFHPHTYIILLFLFINLLLKI